MAASAARIAASSAAREEPVAAAVSAARQESAAAALGAPRPAERELPSFEAPLGVHSPSNFYLGLAGGDVVAAGGLFVATYRVPKPGQLVRLEISMPGGYHFTAKAEVAWTRNPGNGPSSPASLRSPAAPPGFGAQFREITEEGRRLIARYVRNREPLYYDAG